MATFSDTDYEIDVYGWDSNNQVRYFIKTFTTFEDLEIIDYVDQIDEGIFNVPSADWPDDAQSVDIIEIQSDSSIYKGKVVGESESGSRVSIETEGTFTGPTNVVGDVDYSIYVGSRQEASPEFVEQITRFSDLSVNVTAGSMSDWSATIPPQPRLEENVFERVTIFNEDTQETFFVGVLEEVSTEPQESTSISGRGVLVEEEYKSTSVTFSDIAVTDAIQQFATNNMDFDWSFVGNPAAVEASIGTAGKTFTGTHYEIFRDLHNLASIDFNLVYNDWNDVDIQSFRVGEPSPNQTDLTIKDYSRGFDYTNYANKVTVVGANGLTATQENTAEINNFGKTIHKTVRKPRLETQTEVDNAVGEVLNSQINNREQSGSIDVVPRSIDVGFDYTFDVFQNFFLDGKYVTSGFGKFEDSDAHLRPDRRMVPTLGDRNDSMVEFLVWPQIKNLNPNEYQYIFSGYDNPEFIKMYGDGSIGVKTDTMNKEERTESGLVQHNETARVSVLIWNDIFAEDGTVHYGEIWVDGGDQNNADLSFSAGNNIFIDKFGGGVGRVENSPMRIGTNHPIKRFDETSLENHYPIEQHTATGDLIDDVPYGSNYNLSLSGSVTTVSDTPKGEAVSIDSTTSYRATDDVFQTLDSDGFTFLAFVNIDELGTGVDGADDEFRTLFGNGPTPEDGVSSDRGHTFSLTDKGVRVDWDSDGHTGGDRFLSVVNPEPGNWAQVGVQFHYDDTNSEVRIILNGEIVDTAEWTFPDGDYSNANEFSLFSAAGISTTEPYPFLGDVAEVRLMDGDVSEETIEEIYNWQQHRNGFEGGLDDIRVWSDNEVYTDFTDISNGYHLVPSDEIASEPIVAETGETPLQTILNQPYTEVDKPVWAGDVLIDEILRGYVTFDSPSQPDLNFSQDTGSAVVFNNFGVTIPTTNSRVEEAQYTLGMEGGNLSLNLDISSRLDVILSQSVTEIEDTKQVL